MNRWGLLSAYFANKADADLNRIIQESEESVLTQQTHKIKTNLKNCIHVFSRNMEELLLLKTKMKAVIDRTYNFIIGRNQKERPGRTDDRKSMKPNPNWRPTKKGKKNSEVVPV